MQILIAKFGASLPRSLMRMKQSIRHVIHACPCVRLDMHHCADDGQYEWHHEQSEHHFQLLIVRQRIPNDGADKRRARAVQNRVQNEQTNRVAKRRRLARWLVPSGMRML